MTIRKKICRKPLEIMFATGAAILMLGMILFIGSVKTKAATIVNGGNCGDYLSWTLDSEGILTISGEGKMIQGDGMTSFIPPWYDYTTDIKQIVIENGVTSIAGSAFDECTELESLVIPGSVNEILDRSFDDCTNLTSITVDQSNTKYDSRDNCNAIIESDTNTLILGCSQTVIPESVTNIGNFAFYTCEKLTSLKIPKNLERIGWRAFSGCSGLECIEVDLSNQKFDSRNRCNAVIDSASNSLIVGCNQTVIPEGVTEIGLFAFEGRSNLTSIIIPEGVTALEASFARCSALVMVGLPKSLTSISESSFEACRNLSDVYYAGSEADRSGISIDAYNNWLESAEWHYNEDLGRIHYPHQWDEGKITTPVSCTKDGTKTFTCTECEKTKTEKIPATGHKWNKGKITKEATALSAGVKTFTCSVCKKTKTETIRKLTPTIKLSAVKKTIKARKSFSLSISKLAKGDSIKSVKSGKKKIATVKKVKGNKYRITGKKKGKAVITVTLKSGKTAKCTVVVK